MEKTIYPVLMVLLVMTGCAGTQEKIITQEFEETWNFSRPVIFSPENMLSDDYGTRAKALLDYTALEEESKKKVITYLAYMVAGERDAAGRHAIFDLIRDIKAGPYVVAPLVRAYGGTRSAAIRTEISHFINEIKPSRLDIKALLPLLEEKNWDVRIKAIRIMASMKSKAAPAVPEIIGVMHQTGPSYGLYAECFDFAEKINMPAMLAAAALDMAGPEHDLRESALRKMYEVFTNDDYKHQYRQAALNAMVRGMFNGDEELSKLSEKLLQESESPEARAKAAEFEAFNNMKVVSMKELTRVNLKKRFTEEEDNAYLTLKLFYVKNGRNDAVKDIYDPAKSRVKP